MKRRYVLEEDITISDKADRTLTLLRRAGFLMNDFPNDVDDETIIKVCEEIIYELKNK